MASKYIGLGEESSGYSTVTALSGDIVYFKILSESIETTREDYYPETVEYWTPDTHVKGFFRAGGDFEVLMDPNQWPKLLVYFLGDPTTSAVTSSYSHVFTFGGTEAVTTSGPGPTPFTIYKGVGIEKDRQFDGGFITAIEIEARAREVVGCTVSVTGDGTENLITAKIPDYHMYSGQRYLTFADMTSGSIGGTDRLATAPTIEAFRLRLGRGYDTDHYVLGKEYLAAQTLHGFATVDGSMEFTFDSEDEHERFLSIVGGTATGTQSSFITLFALHGDALTSGVPSMVQFSIPETHYTASEAAVTGRDRITQTVNFRGNYHALSGHACQVTVINDTSSYTALANIL